MPSWQAVRRRQSGKRAALRRVSVRIAGSRTVADCIRRRSRREACDETTGVAKAVTSLEFALACVARPDSKIGRGAPRLGPTETRGVNLNVFCRADWGIRQRQHPAAFVLA